VVHETTLTADELEQLRRWGVGLQHDTREEVSAAGRAIVLLVEEIERLHVISWDERLYPAEAGADDGDTDLPRSLRERVRLRLRLRAHLEPSDGGGLDS
jgi:hypothetical protein